MAEIEIKPAKMERIEMQIKVWRTAALVDLKAQFRAHGIIHSDSYEGCALWHFLKPGNDIL